VINCGRRFGKTTLAIDQIAGQIVKKKKRIAYIAPTYQQARDIAWEMLKKVFNGAEFNESRLEMRVNDQVVYLRGWESIETLRGQAFDFLVIDEIAMMRNFWPNWHEVIRPTLTDTKGRAMFISTPKGFNHFYDLYNEEQKDEDYKSFHHTSYENQNIPKEEIDKARKELTEDGFAQEYLADFRKTEGLVYKEFRRESHVISTIPSNFIKRIIGLDFGYTNPAAIVLIGIDYDNTYWVIGEWYKTQQTNEQIAQSAQVMQANEIYPDPERPEGVEVLRKYRLNVREVIKGKDSVEAGIQRVRELFKQNKIKIHQDCKNLIWELETYRYEDKQPDKNIKEVPVKENDHAVDALRYALYTVNLKRPQPIRKPRPVYQGIKIRQTAY
jgi:PBSX family phage terminase large subunit